MPKRRSAVAPRRGLDREERVGAEHVARRGAAAVALARATGMRLRGFHSKSSNSTASSAAATGVREGRRHAAGRTRDQQRLALGRGQVEELQRPSTRTLLRS